jgi:hypothetical protein
MDADEYAAILRDLVANIRTYKDFASFVNALRYDLEDYPDTWKHTDLASFLKALQSFAEGMPDYFSRRGEPMPEQPSWQLLGVMFLAAKSCEYN